MQGLVAFVLIFICTCAYIRAVPRLKGFFLSERKVRITCPRAPP